MHFNSARSLNPLDLIIIVLQSQHLFRLLKIYLFRYIYLDGFIFSVTLHSFLHFHLRSLTFCWKTPCSDYFSVGFLVTISLHFYLNENVFILPSYLKDIFTGHRILWWLSSFNCVYIHHSLPTSFHHFFWKVNCQLTVAFLKGICLRFSLYRCHHYFATIIFVYFIWGL